MRFIKMSEDKNKKEYSIEEVAIEIDKLSTAAKAELASKVKTTVLPFREQSTDRKLHLLTGVTIGLGFGLVTTPIWWLLDLVGLILSGFARLMTAAATSISAASSSRKEKKEADIQVRTTAEQTA
jgi:hypothetical protein